MEKSKLPITPETFNRLSNFINEVAKRNESGSIYGLSQREQIFRALQLQYLTKNIRLVDLNIPQLEDPQDLELELFKKENLTYIFLNSDCLLEDKKTFLPYLNNLTKVPNLTFIFLFQKNITYPWNLKKIYSYHYFFQNLFLYPAYGEKDQNQFIQYLENKFQIQVPAKLKKVIKNECSGNFWLIKEAIRYFSKAKNQNDIFSHEEMIFRLKIIFTELDAIEKSFFEKKVTGIAKLTDDELVVEKYFNQAKFKIPLLEKYIKEKINRESILTLNDKNNITANSLVIDLLFSSKERAVLRFLLHNQAKIISREGLAFIIWGKDNDFTDWALDQFIRRLRIKLQKIGLNPNLIKTIKNRGYLFVNNQNAYLPS